MAALVIPAVVLYDDHMNDAYLKEIFASVQGEGTGIGQRHIFVRFLGCDIRCRYCDTPGSPGDAGGTCSVQIAPGLPVEQEQVANPVSASRLTDFCSRLRIPGPSHPWISLTGGEPLLQQAFLVDWLPLVKKNFSIYLETNGIRDEAVKRVRDLVDVVSMDFKLPSATKQRPFWQEHRRFLAAVKGNNVLVKAVITSDTVRSDVLAAIQVIAEVDAAIPFILQPASGDFSPPASMLIEYQDEALGAIRDCRVIPQAHKLLNVP